MGHDDAMSLAMFWAGALMVFMPLVVAGVVVAVLWRQRRGTPDAGDDAPASRDASPATEEATRDAAAGR